MFLNKKGLDYANQEVKCTLAAENSREKVVTIRGKYNSCTTEERAQIGKNALENGNSRAARHFSKVLDLKVGKLTAGRLKDEYVRALVQTKNDTEGPLVKVLANESSSKASSSGNMSPTRFAQVQEVFLADIKAQVVMNDILDEMIIKTGVPLVSTGEWTMHHACMHAYDRIIPIAYSDDKRQITAVLAASMVGEYLPPQLNYKGKTQRCHPLVSFSKGWDFSHSENHWSNEDTVQQYVALEFRYISYVFGRNPVVYP